MAPDILGRVQRSQISDSDSGPTPNPSFYGARDKSIDHHMTQAEDRQAGQFGQTPVNGVAQPTNKFPEGDCSGITQMRLGDYATTPPIDVPRPKADGEGPWAIDNIYLRDGTFQNGHREDKQVEAFLQNRRTSISFSPEVKTDSGHRHTLEEPLPKLTIEAKPIDKTALKESERYPGRSPAFHRTYSEADIRDYDTVTGKRLAHVRSIFDAQDRKSKQFPSYTYNESSEIAKAPKVEGLITEQATSLTSEATISPILEEAPTPPEDMALVASPISAFPSFAYPTSYEDSSAWPHKPRRRTSSRMSGFGMERVSSMRSSRRPSSRRSTTSPQSPATSFLSRFATMREMPDPDPDSEGQVIGDYVLGKEIGFGGFSSVKEAFTIEGDARVTRAAKIVRKQLHNKDEAENDLIQAEFEHEVSVWRCLAHRNILPLIEVYDTSFATFCFTKLNTGGTLFDLVRANRKGLDGELVRRYAYQLASALRYLHEDVHVVHRDVKLENCLIDLSDPDNAADGGNLLLCDFGLAEFIANDMRSNSPDPFASRFDHPHLQPHPSSPLNPSPSEAASSVAGSLQYASPELLLSPAGFLSPVVDVWAFGVVIYAMLVGDLPFQDVFQPRVQMMILAGEWDMHALETSKGAAGYEDEVTEFVAGCLDMQSEGRWNVGMVLNSRWLRGMQEMLEEREGGFRL